MKYLCIISLLASWLTSLAQTQWRGEQWLRQNDRGSYHEGTYTRDVAGAALELVSLTAQWENYSFKAGQQLKVKVLSPEQNRYFLKAEELSIQQYYWFQSKSGRIARGSHEFTGWKVDRTLRQLQIPARNLGVLATNL